MCGDDDAAEDLVEESVEASEGLDVEFYGTDVGENDICRPRRDVLRPCCKATGMNVRQCMDRRARMERSAPLPAIGAGLKGGYRYGQVKDGKDKEGKAKARAGEPTSVRISNQLKFLRLPLLA